MFAFNHTFRCVADATRAASGRRVQCTRRVSGHSQDSAHHAEQDATDKAVLSGWAPAVGGDWSLVGLRGLHCPRHAA